MGSISLFFVRVLDGDYFFVAVVRKAEWRFFYFCCCRVRSGAVTAISEGVPVFLVPS